MNLTVDDFPGYFSAIHGYQPLPWQHRLARTVLEKGWPRTLSLPTASGKTAVLDIAVFALAAQARLPASERNACRRIALVVDRRIVVDDATRRAERIRERIHAATEGLLGTVRQALSDLAGGGKDSEPLQVATLRGGIYREARWARSPRQPVILCSTVDQVGSRLLYRGYGISSRMAPIHAGLLGNDCCIILDEAHISEPFRQTLTWIAKYRKRASQPLATPFQVVTMTATPRDEEEEPFRLDADDRRHVVLAARLNARKEAVLVAADRTDRDLSKTAVAAIREVLSWHSATTPDEAGAARRRVQTVLVVLNRVASARAVFEALASPGRRLIDADALLLTGRSRSLERDKQLAAHRARLMAGREPRDSEGDRPLVVVATQCVEVGADLDLDALVTEACSLEALRQRLGRCDRMGQRGRSPVRVIARADAVGTWEAPGADPIYGEALGRTWHWLQSLPVAADGCRDLSVVALEQQSAPVGCAGPSPDAPVIYPTYCDLWAQTGPEPAHSPDPAIFLHGPQRHAAEVRIVWRADLDAEHPECWAATVACCPPMMTEGLPLPLHQARAWLAGAEPRRIPDDGGDVPQASPDDDVEPGAGAFRALRWCGPDDSAVVTSEQLRPGDVLLLPCSAGGCDQFGWNPEASTTSDIADEAQVSSRRPAVLRLTPELLDQASYGALTEPLRTLAFWNRDDEQGWPEDWQERVMAALQTTATPEGPVGQIVRVLATSRWLCEPHPTGVGVVISTKRRLGLDFTDEDHTSSVADAPRALIPHLGDVETWAAHYGRDLPPTLAGDLALAGRLHDLGKSDPRFQTWLAGGDPIAAARAGLLAKSRGLSPSRTSAEVARARSGYPEGGRHELLSVRLAESCEAFQNQAHDWELVLHLVASHHGRCRPFAPVVMDPRPLLVGVELDGHRLEATSATGLERLDSGVAERFWALIRRYGWWGLAYLEACLRLADHRASECPGEEARP